MARRASGRSLRTVAHDAGVSASQIGRIERGTLVTVPIDQLARIGAAVGLDVRVRTFPGPDPTLDAGQLAVIGRLRALVPEPATVRLEVLLPGAGDQRAWDVVIDGLSPSDSTASDHGASIAIDVDSRVVDGQAQLRRLHAKRRDSGMDAVLWVLADTPHNRSAVAALGPLVLADFPTSPRRALAALRAGRRPDGSAIILI